MNKRSEQLLRLGNKIVQELNIPNVKFAAVGGSVGRGEADGFSDLDLNIYVSDGSVYDSIFVYEGEIVQLFVTDEIPLVEQVEGNPWEFRFLLETVPVYDPNGEFHILKSWVESYFSSMEGRAKLAKKAIEIVNIRKKWAIDSLNQGKNVSAKLAAGAAWADATGNFSDPFIQRNPKAFLYRHYKTFYLIERHRDIIRQKSMKAFCGS